MTDRIVRYRKPMDNDPDGGLRYDIVAKSLTIDGVPISGGGGSGFTGTPGQASIPFAGEDGQLTEDNTALSWDAASKTLDVVSDVDEQNAIVGTSSGVEGIGVSGRAIGADGVAIKAQAEGTAGIGLIAFSYSGWAAFLKSLTEANTSPTVEIRRATAGALADLLVVSDHAGAPMFKVNKTGGIFATLPTSDPAVAGQLWADAGVVKVSAG